MQVTNIEVTFKRTRQPAQYETSGAEVKWSVALDDGEDAVKATESAIGQVKSIVLAELGLVAPGTNAAASNIKPQAPAAPATPAAAPKAETGTAAAPKKTEAKKAADKPAPAPAPSTSASDIPGEDPPTSNGVRTDAPLSAEKVSAADIPGEEPSTTATTAQTAAAGDVTVTLEEVNALAHAYRKEGKIDTATIKSISREKFGVERISDLKPEQLAGYKDALDAAVKNFAGAAAI